MESPSPTTCNMYICNNNLFNRPHLSIDTVDGFSKTSLKRPGQAVKVITDSKIIDKEVRKEDKTLTVSKSFSHFNQIEDKVEGGGGVKRADSIASLKECKSCDENLIKFIFTKHGIQVISDVETIV